MSALPLIDFIAAEEAKETILDTLESRRHAYIAQARAVARKLYAEIGGPVSVVDVRAKCPPPEEFDPRVLGAVFRKPEWRKVGYAASCRKICHNRFVSLFEPAI